LVSSGVEELDRLLSTDGYPDRSVVLIVGPPGIGKEALGYWFTHSGLMQGDFCLYITRLAVSEVLHDIKGFGVDASQRVPMWMAGGGGEMKCDVSDLSGLSFNIKETLKRNGDRRMRVTTDVLSSLLMLNPTEIVYKFLSQLFAEVKQYNCVLLATLEEGMHDTKVLAAMEQIFDGVVELRLYEEGLRVLPLMRIRKMRGAPPQTGYFNFSFTHGKMEISSYVR
jgi:KaiC/GvpD/RAD55 family RecA-like ATPase